MSADYSLRYADGRAYFGGLAHFDLAQIFGCGQCFRFDPCEDGYEGVADGRYARFMQRAPDTLEIECAERDLPFWTRFLSLDVDYGAVKADILSRFGGGEVICAAIEVGAGIRILRQDAWETLVSFIISQNNNIPRIKALVAAISERYGERIGGGRYAFPPPEALYNAGTDGLAALKTGFRAAYIYDCAARVCDGRLNLAAAAKLDTPSLLAKLQEVRGVGPKVAACAALFGFNRTEAFPVDVWVKRVIAKYFPEGLDPANLGAYAGVAQQYLFFYERQRRT